MWEAGLGMLWEKRVVYGVLLSHDFSTKFKIYLFILCIEIKKFEEEKRESSV